MSDNSAMEITEAKLLTRYQELCSIRDKAYSAAAPLEAQLTETVLQMEQLRGKAEDLARRIEETWGPNHLQLKKEIALLARMLGRRDGPLATK